MKQAIEKQETEERADFNSDLPIPEYHYTGSKPMQIGGDGPIIGSTWSTAHDDPRKPGYINLCSGPLYYQKYPQPVKEVDEEEGRQRMESSTRDHQNSAMTTRKLL